MDVDVDLAEVPVNIMPLLDDTDFKAIEAAIAYNAAAMALYWHFVTPGGAYTVTAVTPTSGGDYDWTDQGDAGIYTIAIPASGGASINNDTEGFGWFTGKATGVLPWRGPVIGFRRAALNDLVIEGGTASTNLEDFFDGTGYAGGTIKLATDATLNATQGSYPPAKAGDKMDIVDAPNSTGVTAIVDAFLTRDWSSVSYTGTVRCVLTALQKLRNKVANVGTTQTVYKENDSTSSYTSTITIDAAADPVTSIDPDA